MHLERISIKLTKYNNLDEPRHSGTALLRSLFPNFIVLHKQVSCITSKRETLEGARRGVMIGLRAVYLFEGVGISEKFPLL
jgi:hypothetical protein